MNRPTRRLADSFFAKQRFPDGHGESNHTLAEYRETYAPEVLTFDQARARFPEFANVTWTGRTPGAKDRIFLGATPREGQTSFMWNDLLSFALAREDGAWRFKAFGG